MKPTPVSHSLLLPLTKKGRPSGTALLISRKPPDYFSRTFLTGQLGFAPWSGGPLSWIDIMVTQEVVRICDALAQKCGPRFNAPALLRDLAEKGESVYGRFHPAQAA